MRVVIDIDGGALTDTMVSQQLTQLNREIARNGDELPVVTLSSPWVSFAVTKIEVDDATGD